MSNLIQTYTNALDKEFTTGLATEHSYRPALKALLDGLLPQFRATNEPTRVECGAPDLIVTRDNVIPMFYVEAKDIGKNLDDIAYKDQFERYQDALGNVIFTDYLEFRFYEGRELKSSIKIAAVQNKKIIARQDNFEIFISTLEKFAHAMHETITTPTQLAKVMAKKAQMLAATIEAALGDGEKTLLSQMAAFKQVLLHDITEKRFSDIYAQTITYGMFAARLSAHEGAHFSRSTASSLIPKTNPFLRKIFANIAGIDLDERVAWIVDDLVDTFCRCNMNRIMEGFGERTRQDDPVIHFYEDFLGEYNPELRRIRGVWFTPQPAVSFIVGAVHEILKRDFGLGIADSSKVERGGKSFHKVQILDPATGTGTFLAETITKIHSELEKTGNAGVWQDYVEKHLLPRVYGFEILMAPYAMAHLKLDFVLEKLGYKHKSKEDRLRVYLTNSLEEQHPDTDNLPFANWLADEANEANRIKREAPVMVVMGNPPYNVVSQNRGEWIHGLLKDYKQGLNERNIQPLSDDYIKFIRLGQHFVERNEVGILAYISNNGFTDGVIHREMRHSLMRSFDKIYILNLHGNSNKKETSPEGSKDENVFDIKQGVSINIFVKTGKKREDELAEVYHCDLFGRREYKLQFLAEKNFLEIGYKKLTPSAPDYFFVPRSTKNKAKYEKGFAIDEIFVKNSAGLVTARDDLTIHYSKEEAIETVFQFLEFAYEGAREKFNLGKDSINWSVRMACDDLSESGLKKENFVPISYRPFDTRWTYFTGNSRGFHSRPRGEVMRNFVVGPNIGLVTARSNRSPTCDHFYITKHIAEAKCGESTVLSYVYPLYIYNGINGHNGNGNGHNRNLQKSFLDGSTPSRTPNLDLKIVRKIADKIGLEYEEEKSGDKGKFAPIDILDYIYAVLHCPKYREKYGEFLKSDFPRIAYPNSKEEFLKAAESGAMLREIHLLENVPDVPVGFLEMGSNLVLKFEYDGREKVWINDKQFFDGVPESVWNFSVGGYRPAQKWLKDRKGRELSYDEIQHYKKIISAISATERIMAEIDEYLDV